MSAVATPTRPAKAKAAPKAAPAPATRPAPLDWNEYVAGIQRDLEDAREATRTALQSFRASPSTAVHSIIVTVQGKLERHASDLKVRPIFVPDVSIVGDEMFGDQACLEGAMALAGLEQNTVALERLRAIWAPLKRARDAAAREATAWGPKDDGAARDFLRGKALCALMLQRLAETNDKGNIFMDRAFLGNYRSNTEYRPQDNIARGIFDALANDQLMIDGFSSALTGFLTDVEIQPGVIDDMARATYRACRGPEFTEENAENYTGPSLAAQVEAYGFQHLAGPAEVKPVAPEGAGLAPAAVNATTPGLTMLQHGSIAFRISLVRSLVRLLNSAFDNPEALKEVRLNSGLVGTAQHAERILEELFSDADNLKGLPDAFVSRMFEAREIVRLVNALEGSDSHDWRYLDSEWYALLFDAVDVCLEKAGQLLADVGVSHG